MPQACSVECSDDLASTDEIKVYKDEGDDEKRSSEILSEEKFGLVTETEDEGERRFKDEDNNSTCSSSNSNNNGLAQLKTFNSLLPFCCPPGLSQPPTSLLHSPPSPTSYVSPNAFAAGAGLYVYSVDQPPPAHMGIPPFHIDPKTGLPRCLNASSLSLSGSDLSNLHLELLSRSSLQAWFSSTSSGTAAATAAAAAAVCGAFPPPPGLLTAQLTSPSSHHSPAAAQPLAAAHGPPTTVFAEPVDIVSTRRFRDRTNGSFVINDVSCSRSSSTSSSAAAAAGGLRQRKVYIKKPLNAFMLFMKEMRQKVIDECTLKESAAINQILGRKWHALERSEQAKYYEMARKEKELHMQLYPGWSARDNYATRTKKKKMKRDVTASMTSNYETKLGLIART